MNEMKPEDVMRAWECCDEGTSEACLKCPIRLIPYPSCKCVMEKHALSLTRKYQAENAKKDAEIERLTVNMNAYGLTAKNLAKEFEDYRADVQMEIADARAEAITEFAERLMKAINPDYPISYEQVNRIAEEMKQGQKAAIDLQHEQIRLTAALQSAAMAVTHGKDCGYES